MPPSYVDSTVAGIGSGGNQNPITETLVMGMPSNQSGDLILVFIHGLMCPLATAPGGWTSLYNNQSAFSERWSKSYYSSLYYRISDGALAGSYNWVSGTVQYSTGVYPKMMGVAMSYRGIDGAYPINAWGNTFAETHSVNEAGETVSLTSTRASMLVWIGSEGGGSSIFLPPDMTSRLAGNYDDGLNTPLSYSGGDRFLWVPGSVTETSSSSGFPGEAYAMGLVATPNPSLIVSD